MEIKWMKTFIVAAQYENFRQASEALFMSQPAVSKHIRRLEEALNTSLFNREGKMVSLTAAGLRFLTIAKKITEQYEQGMAEWEAWKQGYSRKLNIAVAPQIASSFLPSWLRQFMEQYPEIEMVINILNSYDVGREVALGRADLGLARVQPVHVNLHAEIIHEERVLLIGEPLLNLLEDETDIFQKYRLITDNHPEYWENLLLEIKKSYPAIQTMAVNQVEVTKRLIEEGLGVSFLPFSMVKEELQCGKLVEWSSVKVKFPTSKTYLAFKAETEEVRLFSQFLKERISEL